MNRRQGHFISHLAAGVNRLCEEGVGVGVIQVLGRAEALNAVVAVAVVNSALDAAQMGGLVQGGRRLCDGAAAGVVVGEGEVVRAVHDVRATGAVGNDTVLAAGTAGVDVAAVLGSTGRGGRALGGDAVEGAGDGVSGGRGG